MEKMNALVLHGVGDLRAETVDKPEPKKNEVLLRVRACGICSSDIPRIFETGTYHFPTIPGHEFAGVIEAAGKGVDPSYVGKRAAVFPLLPCFACEPCRNGQYAQCRKYSYFGSRCDGAFAEYIAVPEWNIVPLGDDTDYKLGALCEPLAVSLHAFKAAGGIAPEKTAAIVGTGTIGFMIGIAARHYGVKNVIICGRSRRKNELAEKLGFSTVDTSSGDLWAQIDKLTDGRGADYVFESVGTSEAVNQSVELCGTMGTVVLVGNPAGDITFAKQIYWKILRQQINVRGIWNSVYGGEMNDWTEAAELLKTRGEEFGALITDTFALGQYEQAFETIRSREKLTLKVMFEL